MGQQLRQPWSTERKRQTDMSSKRFCEYIAIPHDHSHTDQAPDRSLHIPFEHTRNAVGRDVHTRGPRSGHQGSAAARSWWSIGTIHYGVRRSAKGSRERMTSLTTAWLSILSFAVSCSVSWRYGRTASRRNGASCASSWCVRPAGDISRASEADREDLGDSSVHGVDGVQHVVYVLYLRREFRRVRGIPIFCLLWLTTQLHDLCRD